MKRRHDSSRDGFTLVEVLATLVLLAIVLPVVMRGAQLALRSANTARHLAEASALAETKLNDMLLSGEWNQSAASGDFGAEYPGYQWTCETQTRDYGVVEIFLTVTWQEGGRPNRLSLATMTQQSSTGGMP